MREISLDKHNENKCTLDLLLVNYIDSSVELNITKLIEGEKFTRAVEVKIKFVEFFR